MRYRLLLAPLGLCAVAGLSVGCRSIVSTHVTPNPYEGGWKTEKVRGMPVTVVVPTHLEVRVVERRFYQPGGDFEHLATTRIVAEKVHEKAQLFMVDAARPAAGDLTFAASFKNTENPQFFSAYDAKADDKTIATISKLVPGLPDVLSNLKKARAIAEPSVITPADASLAMAFTDHIVAVRVFDLADPSLTDAVKQFMSEYVNCQPVCPTACPAVPK